MEARPPRLCAIVHAYYPELLGEILRDLQSNPHVERLIVTTVADRADEVRSALDGYAFASECRVYENRGRDVLPFLTVASELVDGPFDVVLKLHTKRSNHRQDGDAWRRDVLEKLLAREQVSRIIAAFQRNPRVGIVVPAGHVLALHAFWGSNRPHVTSLSRRIGHSKGNLGRDVFPGGSMFYARLDALRPLLDAHLDSSEFEPEAGQRDATLAHAVERCLGVSARLAGMIVTDTEEPERAAEGAARYAFAKASLGRRARLAAFLRRK